MTLIDNSNGIISQFSGDKNIFNAWEKSISRRYCTDQQDDEKAILNAMGQRLYWSR